MHGDRQWTYRELNARANRLARALLARGLRPRGRGRRGHRAQPGLDGRGDRRLQGGRGVPADRAALPGRPDRHHARPRRLRAGADRARQHRQLDRRSTTLPGVQALLVDDAYARGATPTAISASRSRRTSSPTSTSPPAPPASPRARCASTPAWSTTCSPRSRTWDRRGRGGRADRARSASTSRCGSSCPRCWSAGGRCSSSRTSILDVQRFVDTSSPAGQRAAGRAVLPGGRAHLPGAAPARAARPALRLGHRRGAEEGARAALVRRRARHPAGQRLRADRDLRRHQPRGHDRVPGRRPGPARPRRCATCASTSSTRTCPVPLGAPGEIVFSGVCVGRGYVNDPERTAAAFLHDPHRPGERLYRERRLRPLAARRQAGVPRPPGHPGQDPRLPHRDRRDRERAAARARGARRRRGGRRARDGKHLVGVLRRPASRWRRRAARTAGRALPATWCPPCSTGGEPAADRQRQDRHEGADRARRRLDAADGRRRAPRTPTERRLAAAWAEVLGVPAGPDRPHDHFFDRGGTSLSAVRLAVALDAGVSLKDIVRHPVLADLAALSTIPACRRLTDADGRPHRTTSTSVTCRHLQRSTCHTCPWPAGPPLLAMHADRRTRPAWARRPHRAALRARSSPRTARVLVRGLGLRDPAQVGAVFRLLGGEPDGRAGGLRRPSDLRRRPLLLDEMAGEPADVHAPRAQLHRWSSPA